MKKLFFIAFAALAFNGFSQNEFEISFERTISASTTENAADSMFNDIVVIKIFEVGAANSINLKFFNFENDAFTEIQNSTTQVSSLNTENCNTVYCFYKRNDNIVIINLGSSFVNGNKHKVYIKISGAAGKGELIKEVEL
jgi:hypothetical protein